MNIIDERFQPALWPDAGFGSVERLRVLARVLPNVHLAEIDLDVSFREAWTFLSDIERSVPLFDQEVSRLRITARLGPGQLAVRAVTRRVPVPFVVTVDPEPGLIWMQTRPVRAYVVGMAAEPLAEDRSRYAQLEGLSRAVGGIGRFGRRRLVRHVEADVAAVGRLLDPTRVRGR